MADLRRAGGRGVDREHEHGVGRQQEALPHVGRDYSNEPQGELGKGTLIAVMFTYRDIRALQ